MALFGPPDIKKLEARGDVKALIRALHHKRQKVRTDAAYALGSLGDERGVDSLTVALQDQAIDVRRAAALSLGQLGDVRALDSLLASLQDDAVKMMAAGALGRLGDAAVEPLVDALSHNDWGVVQGAARALGEIRNRRALQPLIVTVGRQEEWLPCRDIIEAIGTLGEDATEALIAAFNESDGRTRRRVTWALGRSGGRRAVDFLNTLLESADGDTQAVVKLALLPKREKSIALELKSWYRAQAKRWWSSSDRRTAICDDRNEDLRYEEGFLRPGYLTCEECTDRFLALVKDWDDEARRLYRDKNAFFAELEAGRG